MNKRQQDDCCQVTEQNVQAESILLSQGIDDNLASKGIILLEDDELFGGSTINAKKLLLDLGTDPDIESIEIYINSCGGNLMTFISLYDCIGVVRKLYKKPVSTIVTGIAASAAALVLQAGSPRFATQNSYVMIHEVLFGFEGKTAAFKKEYEAVKKFENMAFNIWAKSMGLTVKALRKMIENEDLYFTAKEALAKGLIDKVI